MAEAAEAPSTPGPETGAPASGVTVTSLSPLKSPGTLRESTFDKRLIRLYGSKRAVPPWIVNSSSVAEVETYRLESFMEEQAAREKKGA